MDTRQLLASFEISIHALREEGDTTLPVYPAPMRYISIHALREEGDFRRMMMLRDHDISIHALREEGDGMITVVTDVVRDFYPRPPRGGRPQKVELRP